MSLLFNVIRSVSAESIKRLPIYSLTSGTIVAAVLVVFAISGLPVPKIGLGAIGILPLAAALVDAVRLRSRSAAGGAGQGGPNVDGTLIPRDEFNEWLDERAESLAAREQEINLRALALQQWMQFPDAIDFKPDGRRLESTDETDSGSHIDPNSLVDPMARHDRELIELVEAKTRELFDNIKHDAYRKGDGDRKVFDNEKIRDDLIALVSDVAAIYRPGETAPLLKTNVEAVSRAVGRASLRLLVAVENLPGGLASYNFQTIYSMVIRAVKTFGIYKSAKPYIDVASSVLFAGRIVSSTNPLTLVAWWAASRATTYGASKLGSHVLDQQAVGLIRQLVEIVAIEVASIYSPMVRYRDVHWIYGVELVHMAGELAITDSARAEAMRQVAALNLRDEYARVSLIRHLADGSTPRPDNYNPSIALSASDRKIVVERLEAFLLAHVLGNRSGRTKKSDIDAWQAAAAERLDIQFRASNAETSQAEQSERAIWALASFALQHFGDEPDQAIDHVSTTRTWNAADEELRSRITEDLRSDPPYLYHPPDIDPDSDISRNYLDDLVDLAAKRIKPSLLTEPEQYPLRPESAADIPVTGRAIDLPIWPGEEALRVTAYYLRTDAKALMHRYRQSDASYLLRHSYQTGIGADVARVIHYIAGEVLKVDDVRCVFSEVNDSTSGQKFALTRIGSTLVCFRIDSDAESPTESQVVRVTIVAQCELRDAKIEKVTGYVRSDCRVTFPDKTELLLPGSTLSGYDAYFKGLLSET